MELTKLPEKFYHYLWKQRALYPRLKTTNGDVIQIINPGIHNHDSGPDFLLAKVRIGATLWVGNVEIHVKGSDWYHHRHHKDEAYNNVILHVVAENDKMARDRSGNMLQTLCLEGAFDIKLIHRYAAISQNLLWIPCMNMIREVDQLIVVQCLQSNAIDRLQHKSRQVLNELKSCNDDWEECCYRLICKQFGSKINTTAFEMLAKTVPARILMKHTGERSEIEALLFGQSGLIHSRLRESYPKNLKKEHRYLASKYGLSPMPGYIWKFLRLRPAAFPSLRISQLAELYTRHQKVFGEMLEKEDFDELIKFFDLASSEYWDTHYVFGKKSKIKRKRFGRQSAHILIINAIIPLMHLYGEVMNQPHLCDRAISFLEDLPPEKNAIVKRWNDCGIQVFNALESQGLLQLKKSFCENKRCLECPIGHFLLKR